MMADRGPPFAALRALEAACRLKSYSLAGDELGVTHSAVSQSVRRLEQTYGQRLFWRQGSGMSPSPAALALAQAYREAERILLRAGEDLKMREGEGSLVLSTLPSIAKLWLGPKLGRLQEAMPGVMVEVRTGRELANLQTDGVDVALRVGFGHWPGLRSELLFEEYVFPVCSPEFLARHHSPGGGDEHIAHGPLILEDVNLWPAWFEAAGICVPVPLRGQVFDDSALCVEAAAAGLGVALVRRLHAQEALAAGRLVRMSNIRIKDPYSCYLVWRDDSPRIGAIRRFADWVLTECDRAGLLKAA
jgi:LysR family transcriptional regulator, glycine cleavage system transcriptional activator